MIRLVFRLVAVLALALILIAAYLYLPGERRTDRDTPTATAGDSTSASEVMARIRAVVDGEVAEVTLRAAEIGALLSGPLGGQIPEGVGAPRVALDGGTVRAVLPVPLESAVSLPDIPGLSRMIPDTVRATVRALVASADGSFSVHVERLALAGVPIPGFLMSSIARRLGIGGVVGDSDGSGTINPLTWPLPSGVEAVYIDGDRLVLRGD